MVIDLVLVQINLIMVLINLILISRNLILILINLILIFINLKLILINQLLILINIILILINVILISIILHIDLDQDTLFFVFFLFCYAKHLDKTEYTVLQCNQDQGPLPLEFTLWRHSETSCPYKSGV